jgi:hypothetical protein
MSHQSVTGKFPTSDQPWINHWPTWNEPLSKITAPFDIEAARLKLARRFNTRPPTGRENRRPTCAPGRPERRMTRD